MGGSEGLTVCIVAPAVPIQAGLSSMLAGLESIDKIYTAGSLEEFDPYRSVADILIIYQGAEIREALGDILDDSALRGVLVLVSGADERSRLIPEGTNFPWGLLPLAATLEQFESAVHAIAAGLSIGIPAAVSFLQDERQPGQDDHLVDPLTDRELEVLQLLAQGKANKQIAHDLEISEHTVKFHVSSIYTKLGAGNRTEAVRLGVRQGLITL
jgi:DNA-binding NarL/FixJ family response regulator